MRKLSFFTLVFRCLLIYTYTQRQRETHRLNSKSPNAYARYERGKNIPTVEKLNQLMKAIDPGFELILKIA